MTRAELKKFTSWLGRRSYATRVERDAIRFPLRYPDPRDRELVALLTACLAYGRVDLFSRELERIFSVMGPSPAAFVADFDVSRHARVFEIGRAHV